VRRNPGTQSHLTDELLARVRGVTEIEMRELNRHSHGISLFTRIRGGISVLMAAFLFVLGTDAPVWAAAAGGQVNEFMSYGAGARSLGMGGAFTAVADDASAGYWNPAGLSQLTRKELTLMKASLFADTTYDFYSFVKPSKKGGSAWALSMTKLTSAGFEKVNAKVDNANQIFTEVTTDGTFAVEESAMTWSYGRKVVDRVAIGTSLNKITRAVDTSSDGAMAADLGALIDTKDGRRRIGMTIRNVYAKISGDTEDTMPLVFRFGVSDQFFKKRLLLSFDLDKNIHANMGFHMGGEFGFSKNFKGRFGLQGEQGDGIRETDVGFGYTIKSVTLDYSMGLHELDTTTRMGLTWRFGRSVLERRDENVRGLVQKAYAAADKGNFLVVQEQLQAALDVDPGNKNVIALVEKFQKVVATVPSATGNEEAAVMTRKGIMNYVNGNLKETVNALRQGYYKDPRNEKLLSLLNKIEAEAGMEKTEAPRGPELFTPIDQKVFDARQAILEGKYDVAIKKTQDILDINPNDVTALKIMGSAFFLLDDHVRARKLWNQVLDIDSSDKEIPEFLKQLRPE
jgi:tetratricopeptide (TPR) repeat protein